MKKIIQFGEDVEGYAIPVLNEREIRAAAGIMFLALFTALMLVIFKEDFLPVKYVVVIFLADFIIRVFISPRFSPLLITGRLIVSRQVPEYVGAAPKKFAWTIGFALAALMFVLLVIFNYNNAVTLFSCIACLVFLFFESAFGICLACWAYGLFNKKDNLLCPGETCKKQSIQKISTAQLLIVACWTACVLLAVFLSSFAA